MATTITQGNNADVTVTGGQCVLLDGPVSGKSVIKAVSGVAGSAYRKVIEENHSGRQVYGPFEPGGVIKIGAVVGSVDYTVGTSEEFDNGNGFVGAFDGSGGASLPAGGTTGQALTKASDNDGDAEWTTISGSGDVAKVGTPVDNQIGIWTGNGTIEGDAALTFDTSTDTLTIGASGNLAFGAVTVIDDNAGTTTLQNIDAIDATTEATIEAAIDTLANLTSIQGQTITLTGAFIRSGAHSLTITTGATTSVTFPASGTLATLAGSEALTGKTYNGLTLTTTTGTLTITNGKTLSVSNTLTFTGTDSSSVAFGTGGTVAYANATVTLSTNNNLDRATHGNRLIIADTGGVTLTVLDDTAGSWGSGDVIYGVFTASSGTLTLAADATGTASTVTAGYGMSLVGYPGQEFSLYRTGTHTWRGGFPDPALQQNSQSAAYTTVMADRNKHILHPTADNNARTFTIDSNANVPYPIGTTITFINQINTVTIAITSDTLTLAGAGTTGSRTLAANGIATAIKVSSTGWVINGTGLT